MNARREFSKKVRLQIIKRSLNERGQPCCEGCGGVLKPGQAEVDHTIPEALVVDKSRELTADDGKLLGVCCHRGKDGKTNADVAQIAKARRQESRHLLPKKPVFRRPPPGYKYNWGQRCYMKVPS
jgi:hypothetical protein